MSYCLHLYPSAANLALTNPYLRLVRVADALVSNTLGVLAVDTTWANSVISLSKNAVTGSVPITIPVNLPAGEYDLLVYDAAVPNNADEVQIGKRIVWSGKHLGYPKQKFLDI